MTRVTIDDRITRLKEHSVSIEVVERVDRTCFYTTGCSIPLEHEDENVLWVRGQHVLDSSEVKAARSAVALGEKQYGDAVEERQRKEFGEAMRQMGLMGHAVGSPLLPPPPPMPVPVPFPGLSGLPRIGGAAALQTVPKKSGR